MFALLIYDRIFKIFLKIVKLESWTVVGIGVCGETLNVMSVSLLASYLLLAKRFLLVRFQHVPSMLWLQQPSFAFQRS